MYRILLSVIFILITNPLFPQKDAEITEYLVMIENGKSDEVKEKLPDLKRSYPAAPSILYLEGILTEDGFTAVKLFKAVIQKYPKSGYADASLYRLYSYYAALNDLPEAEKYSDILLKQHSSSPYTKLLPSASEKKISVTSEYFYTIQAGAFANNSNAENLRRKFEKAGYYTEVKDKIAGGTIFKIVYTGRFKTMREAESFQVVLNKKYGLKGIITKYQ